MLKKLTWLPLVLVGLACAFCLVSLLVFLTGGATPWVRRKLRLGALLLTLSGLAGSIPSSAMDRKCYVKVPTRGFFLTVGKRTFASGRDLYLKPGIALQLRGHYRGSYQGSFSWSLVEDGKTTAKGPLRLQTEKKSLYGIPFRIPLPPLSGKPAILYVFNMPLSKQPAGDAVLYAARYIIHCRKK